jgi:hypothetical protein
MVTVRTEAMVGFREEAQKHITTSSVWEQAVLSFLSGCAIAQTITRLFTGTVWVQFSVASSGICGCQNGIKKVFSKSFGLYNKLPLNKYSTVISSVQQVIYNQNTK